MACSAEEVINTFLQRLAGKLVQADVQSLSKKVINTALDKALGCLPQVFILELEKNKDLYADLLQGYVEELSSEKCHVDLPYNLYLYKNHRKIDQLVSSDLWKKKDILIKNLLQKTIASVSTTDILQIMNVAGSQESQGRSTQLLEDLFLLKTISGRLTDIESILKLMSICCRLFLSSEKKSIDISIRKQINLELESLLITCKTRFTCLEQVSHEEKLDYYDYLVAMCCLYAESVAITETQVEAGKKLCNFINYILMNSFQHQLDLLLQIDPQHLSNENIFMPLISKTFDKTKMKLSCGMQLRYLMAAKHVCVPSRYTHARELIKRFSRNCQHLEIPSRFYVWLIDQLPELENYLDEDDDIAKFLMECPECVQQSLIILLSRKPIHEYGVEDDECSTISYSDTETEYSDKKRKYTSTDDDVLPEKLYEKVLGQ